MSWDERACNTLRELVGLGLSYAEIGDRMGRTKNACVSKARGMGIAHLKASAGPGGAKPARPWDDAALTALTRLTAAGVSFAAIGRSLGRPPGSCRKMAQRLNLANAHGRVRRRAVGAERAADADDNVIAWPGFGPSRARAAGRPPPRPRPKTRTVAGPRACQWPEGDPGAAGFHFCGEAVETGYPYCTHHCAKAYRLDDGEPWTPAGAARQRGWAARASERTLIFATGPSPRWGLG